MRHLYKEYPKEFYRLWWEYLRRSERYKDFCLKFGTPEQDADPYLDYTFTDNGDVHQAPLNDFEQWYQFKKLQIRFEQIPKSTTVITYFDDLVRLRFQTAVDRLTKELEREPTLSEFQDHFLNDWRMNDLSEFVVTPGLYDSGKEIGGTVQEWMKGRSARKPTTNYSALKKYLKIYDIKQAGLNVNESICEAVEAGVFEFEPDDIMPSYDPSIDIDFFNKERSFNRGYIQAMLIIQNTESNHFPGEH